MSQQFHRVHNATTCSDKAIENLLEENNLLLFLLKLLLELTRTMSLKFLNLFT